MCALLMARTMSIFLCCLQCNDATVPRAYPPRSSLQAALDHLLERSDINPRKIILFGRSLGGAVAADLCFRNPHQVRRLPRAASEALRGQKGRVLVQ